MYIAAISSRVWSGMTMIGIHPSGVSQERTEGGVAVCSPMLDSGVFVCLVESDDPPEPDPSEVTTDITGVDVAVASSWPGRILVPS